MKDLSDEELAVLVQNGNNAQFDALIDRYEPKIARYAHKFLIEGDDAKDAVQDVFIKVYANIKDFDVSRRFSPWIYRIAHNEFVNIIKKRSRYPLVSLDADVIFPFLSSDDSADQNINKEEIKNTIDESLKDIPPKYREPLVLYYFEDLDYKQIADVMRIPVATVGVRLRRGKIILKNILQNKNNV